MRKIFTFLFAALMSVGMFATTVTWNSSTLSSIDLFDGQSFTQDGVTLTALSGLIDGMQGNWMGNSNDASFKFSTSLGNFTRIEITGDIRGLGGSGWTQTSPGAVWTGEANETTFGMYFRNVSQIVFTIGEPAPAAKYYVVGNMTNWEVNEAYEMTPNNEALTEEYMYTMDLTTTSQFKVVKVEGENQTWYPDGMGNNYGENGEITKNGNYNIYFRPNMDGGEAWFNNCIYVERNKQLEWVVFGVNVPANGKPESIELVGDFEGATWENGIVLTVSETGWYTSFEVYADANDKFKIRSAGSWDNEIYARTEAGWTAAQNFKFGNLWLDDTWKGTPCKLLELDLSGANYGWKQTVQGIENIKLTEKAEKVIVDGVLYIVRDGKLFNLTGAQVK